MKHFEKWDVGNKINFACISGSRELDVQEERRKSWKAALGWILNECVYTEEDGHDCISTGMIDVELLNNQTDNNTN